MGPTVCVVRWNYPYWEAGVRAAVALGQLKKSLNGHTFGQDENVKATVVQWNQKQPRDCFVEKYIWLCVHGMPASSTTGTIFNFLYSLA
jgi:hypothetical protein